MGYRFPSKLFRGWVCLFTGIKLHQNFCLHFSLFGAKSNSPILPLNIIFWLTYYENKTNRVKAIYPKIDYSLRMCIPIPGIICRKIFIRNERKIAKMIRSGVLSKLIAVPSSPQKKSVTCKN